MAFGTLTPYRRGSVARDFRPQSGSLFDLHRQMNRLFDDFFADAPGGGGPTTSFPPMEVSQEDGKIEICAELPGVRQEDVDLSVEDGVLTLKGEKKTERKDESGYSERSYGRFERRISLPSNIDEDRCEAEFKDGVLRITIPRDERKTRGRRIPLGTTSSQASGQGAEESLIDRREDDKSGGTAGQNR